MLHESQVKQAQFGNTQAYAELVAAYQDVALATARAWLGERESARDAVQEAFLEAYLNIQQLREPAAFPGWLRRIVLKQCDRQTRRKALPLTAMDEATELSSSDPTALSGLIEAEREQGVRQAVESLPEDQRMIVALHYYGDITGQQIADFLELPLSTVKQRLRVARTKLKETGIEEQMMESVRKEIPTSEQLNLPKEISLFIALREGDKAEVARLIDQTPELVNAEQNWNRDLVYEGVLPFATRATALITAIELDDLPMQKLLIEKGADVNVVCGCETGESAIWAATLLNRIAHAQHLLVNKADPNVFSASGNTPLHIAAMRGHTEIVRMLLAHGANSEAQDIDSNAIWPITAGATQKEGWRPLDWARHNGHSNIVAMLDGKSKTNVSRNACVITLPIIQTGIKAIDFFTPLKRGGLIRVPFKAGVGMVVLWGELNQAFLSQSTGAVVWTGFTQPPFDLPDWEAEMNELGLRNKIHSSLVSYREDSETQRKAFEDGINLMADLQRKGKDVLAVIQSAQGFEMDIEQAMFRLASTSETGSITSIVVTPFRDEEQSWQRLKAPYTSQISLDRTRAMKNLYPTVNPALSISKLGEGEISERHQQLLTHVKDLFAWYREQDPEFEKLDIKEKDDKTVTVHDLINYFSQPFKVTEPFRGSPGQSIAIAQVLDEVEAILGK